MTIEEPDQVPSHGVSRREWNGWELREAGPDGARRSVLLLPGALCTAAFYDGLLTDPRLVERGVRFVAATPPGFGGRPAPDDVSIEGFARLTGELAANIGCDVVVGHSFFANVAIEMAAAGLCSGPIVALSPCFSREDEEKDFRQIDRISRVPGLGRLPWLLLPRMLNSSLRGRLPADRHTELVAEMRATDMAVCRRMTRLYFDYLDRHGSLVPRLRASGVDAWVVRGDRDEIGLSEEERRDLEASPNVTMVTVPHAAHFVMTDQPAPTADLIIEVAAGRGA